MSTRAASAVPQRGGRFGQVAFEANGHGGFCSPNKAWSLVKASQLAIVDGLEWVGAEPRSCPLYT